MDVSPEPAHLAHLDTLRKITVGLKNERGLDLAIVLPGHRQVTHCYDSRHLRKIAHEISDLVVASFHLNAYGK